MILIVIVIMIEMDSRKDRQEPPSYFLKTLHGLWSLDLHSAEQDRFANRKFYIIHLSSFIFHPFFPVPFSYWRSRKALIEKNFAVLGDLCER